MSFINKSIQYKTDCVFFDMAPKWNRTTVLKLIELYKENRCLYDRQERLFHNRVVRSEIYEKILKEVQLLQPELTDRHLKYKIESLKSQYTAHKRNGYQGKNKANLNTPANLWCHLDFLDQFKNENGMAYSPKTKSKVDETDSTEDIDHFETFSYDGAESVKADADIDLSKIDTNKNEWDDTSINTLVWYYQQFPILYDIWDSNYRCKTYREEAYNCIYNEVVKVKPNLDLLDVKLKIKEIRTNFGTEYKKVEYAKKTINRSQTTYAQEIPKYEQLKFLRNYITNSNIGFDEDSSTSEDICYFSEDEISFHDEKIDKPEVLTDDVESENNLCSNEECNDDDKQGDMNHPKKDKWIQTDLPIISTIDKKSESIDAYCAYLCNELKRISDNRILELKWKILDLVQTAIINER